MKYIALSLCIALLSLPVFAPAAVSVTEVDFLPAAQVKVNAAGPVLVMMDEERGHLIVANTLTSTLSLIDTRILSVRNIGIGGRTLQHLKAEALTYRKKTGDVYLIGDHCVHMVSPKTGESFMVPTGVQFESIAVHEPDGIAFLAGRESAALGRYDPRAGTLAMIDWLDGTEKLMNLNQTPPPPIRKVVADAELGTIVAIDGMTATMYLFDATTGMPAGSRALSLERGGRWHLAGYNDDTHYLYVVVETATRRVIQAAKIDVAGERDVVVPLPEFTEGVGILYNPDRDEVYIPYDNHPSVHVVEFANGTVREIKIPAYGNDASALDLADDLLFVASWAHGEIDVIDISERSLVRRITGLGIIPHMFTMAFDARHDRIFFPKGASAVNGTFGAAVTALDPFTMRTAKIATGWAPVDLIELKGRNSVLVFNSEDQFAEVRSDGSYDIHTLPFEYPIQAAHSLEGDVYLSYGPHQSYWPVVYIWGAKDGVITIDADDLSYYDRRISRQAQRMALDRDGVLYFTQNNWGREEQFIGTLEDQVRLYESGRRIALADTVEREITQRLLEYDADRGWLYLVRVGETDSDPSLLQIVDPAEKKVLRTVPLGLTATDIEFDEAAIYVANFDSRSVSVIDKNTFEANEVRTAGERPFRLCRAGDDVYVVHNTRGVNLEKITGNRETFSFETDAVPDNLFLWQGSLVITAHTPETLGVFRFDPDSKSFETLFERAYPYGDTRFDSCNVSFYVRGQYGDAVFDITRAIVDKSGRLWITDFLSGKAFILRQQ